MPFQKNVFVNCPFDAQYLPLLRPLLFTVIDLGFVPRIALESLDSGRPRIEKIISLVKESKFAIHDLSRLQARKKDEYFRLNMPFELGIDVGCRLFKGGRWSEKRCLILETERYRYQAAISDISNSDIAVHNDKPDIISAKVRNWLNGQARLRAHGPDRVWARFNEFMTANYDELTAEIRLRANGICNTLGRGATVVSPFIVGALMASYQLPGVVWLMIGLVVIQIVVVWAWGVEPRNRGLEEVAAA